MNHFVRKKLFVVYIFLIFNYFNVILPVNTHIYSLISPFLLIISTHSSKLHLITPTHTLTHPHTHTLTNSTYTHPAHTHSLSHLNIPQTTIHTHTHTHAHAYMLVYIISPYSLLIYLFVPGYYGLVRRIYIYLNCYRCLIVFFWHLTEIAYL